jgi:hypothetical protein
LFGLLFKTDPRQLEELKLEKIDCIVIGAGVVWLAVARALAL